MRQINITFVVAPVVIIVPCVLGHFSRKTTLQIGIRHKVFDVLIASEGSVFTSTTTKRGSKCIPSLLASTEKQRLKDNKIWSRIILAPANAPTVNTELIFIANIANIANKIY
ncbi:hypothetical protein GQX74_014876 [Glossina fuscipes]|nr:hypothetical protein GQX74_014876 [Glossina fuscipes]